MAKKLNSNTIKPGEIYDEVDVYAYVQRIHGRSEDFEDGDLGPRIEKYKKYKVENIDISKLNLDRFEIDQNQVEKYKNQYQKYKAYLPIVIKPNYEIIDGNHRATALNDLGINKILVLKGTNSIK
jgi:hypothetical protein